MQQRISRLQGGRQGFRVLALDHGLTVGSGSGAPCLAFTPLVRECAPFIDGIILNYGLTRKLPPDTYVNVILQCFGAPKGMPRVLIGSLDTALRIDACAVALQFNLKHPSLSDHVREIADFVHKAHSFCMPVLFMTSGFDNSSVTDISNVLRICCELGADFIKIESNLLLLDTDLIPAFRRDLTALPSILLAGESSSDKIFENLSYGMELGFSGYCIGRNIFEHDSPNGAVKKFDEIVSKSYNKEK